MPPRSIVLRAVAALALAVGAPAGAGCGDSRDDKPAGTTLTTSTADRGSAQRVAAAQRAAQAAPNDPDALAALARGYVAHAYVVGNVTGNTLGPAGEAQLRKAEAAWDRYLALDPRKPDVQLATQMARAFSQVGLDEPPKAVRALEIAAQNSAPPNGSLYAQIAVLRYNQDQFRPGDVAARRALELAPRDQRTNLRRALRQIRLRAKTQGP
ncbi:MAG: hypothetical protein ACRDLS_12455 [Solirubrobacteraceae bacterium]